MMLDKKPAVWSRYYCAAMATVYAAPPEALTHAVGEACAESLRGMMEKFMAKIEEIERNPDIDSSKVEGFFKEMMSVFAQDKAQMIAGVMAESGAKYADEMLKQHQKRFPGSLAGDSC